MDLSPHQLPLKIQRGDYAISRHFLLVEPGVTPDHVVDPDFWVHVAARLRVMDRIEVVAADGSFDMELRVVAIDPRGLWAQVRPLSIVEGKLAVAASGQFPDKDGYTIEFSGVHRWRIIRAGEVVAKDFADQTAAAAALANIKAAKRSGDPAPAAAKPAKAA